MNVVDRLRAILDVVAEEAEANKKFARRLELGSASERPSHHHNLDHVVLR
jgi:hypothetical protein